MNVRTEPLLHIKTDKFESFVFGKKDLRDVKKDSNDENRRESEKFFLSRYFQTEKRNIFFLKQEHGDRIIHVENSSLENNNSTYFNTGDSIFTEIPEIILCIRTADCLPVFFTAVDGERKLAGIVHAGWRGLANGLICKTILLASESCGYKPEHFSIFYGPSAGGDSYQVQEDVAKLFTAKKKNSDNSYMLDLRKNALIQLDKYQHIHENFFDCTMEKNDLFYSHRKGDRERNLNVIVIRK